jgi:hypothetical protein
MRLFRARKETMTVMTTMTTEARYFPPQMGVPLAAEYLRTHGVRSNPAYMYGLVSAGVVRSHKEGKRLIVLRADLDHFIVGRVTAEK